MTFLVVDNHDSYTHNLVQLLTVVTGQSPVVVTDDDAPADLDPARFSGVVISPGPGSPEQVRDFGLSAEVLRRSASTRTPVLGVCLGMQGLGWMAGARVERAPAARHGMVDRVRHTATSILTGLPQDFAAVRYHSLRVAEPLPPELEALAWAQDGVLMALRHRDLPFAGVQFHPESIASEHGRRIVENFVAGCAPVADVARHGSPARSVVPGTRLRVRSAGLDRAVDLESAFEALGLARSANSFWMDSGVGGAGSGRFSFCGDDSGPFAELLVPGPGHVLGDLRDHLDRYRVEGGAHLPFPFTGAWVGWAGYEVRGECGLPTTRRADTPVAAWLFADRFVAVDHDLRRTFVVALHDGGTDGETDVGSDVGGEAVAQQWIAETLAVLAGVADDPGRRVPAPVRPPVEQVAELLLREPGGYADDVRAAQEELRAGQSYEICLTAEARRPADPGVSGFAVYRELRRRNPAPYGAYLRLAGVEVLSSSPERFLRITDGTVETRPIKGTVRRSTDPAEDAFLAASLVGEEKTRAENLIVVDLLRNDIGRISEPGSVEVPHLMHVETHASVHQLVSTVVGRVAAGLGPVDVLQACFPPGSMTGAPKLRTTEIIDALEDRARGIYSGTLGWIGAEEADLAVVIRTLVLADGVWRTGAGGAIVLDSDPEAEVAEMLLKAATPFAAVLGD